MLCRIIQGLDKAKLASEAEGTALQPMLHALRDSLSQQDLPHKMAKAVKELHTSVAKLGKVSLATRDKARFSMQEGVSGAFERIPDGFIF